MKPCEVVYIANVQKTYATVLGVVLLLVGLLGFFNNPILGLFGVNTAQNILHLVAGVLGIWFGTKGEGKGYNMWTGIIAAVVAILWFVPGTGSDTGLLNSFFGINAAISYLHAAIAVVSLIVAYGVKE